MVYFKAAHKERTFRKAPLKVYSNLKHFGINVNVSFCGGRRSTQCDSERKSAQTAYLVEKEQFQFAISCTFAAALFYLKMS